MSTPTGSIRLYMSMSVDGFITGPDDSVEHGLGIGGERLHSWLGDERGPDPLKPDDAPGALVYDEILATGAVITGRRTYEHAGRWDGDHHDGVPIFVLTHAAPDDAPPGSVQYVTDGIESCVTRAKAAAGGRDILLHGAATAQECLRAGLLDELEIQLMPVLLGQGRRLFEDLPPEVVELEPVRALEGPGVMHLRYRVVRP